MEWIASAFFEKDMNNLPCHIGDMNYFITMVEKQETQTVPFFPLKGALLLPGGHLPLNIFEPRYLNMVDDSLRTDRKIAMIQPNGEDSLYKIGCIGRLTSFHETEDGRYLITLTGLTRFEFIEEIDCSRGYRKAIIDTNSYNNDLDNDVTTNINWQDLATKLDQYLKVNGIESDIQEIEDMPKSRLLTVLSMVCPFSSSEKQALLEAKTCEDRFELFTKIVNIAIQTEDNSSISKH